MDNFSDKINVFFNRDFILKLLSLFEEIAIKSANYEYIQVHYRRFNKSFFWKDEGYRYVISGANIEINPNINKIDLFNQLGRHGWKLVVIENELIDEYDDDDDEDSKTYSKKSYNSYIFERKLSTNSEFYLLAEEVLDKLGIKKEKLEQQEEIEDEEEY